MTKPIRIAPLCAAVAAFLLWTACANHSVRADASVKPEKDRKAAPEFSLKDSNGQTVHLADYKGKVVLLDFWGTWCPPCVSAVPWLRDLQRHHAKEPFVIVGISSDSDEGLLREAERRGSTWRSLKIMALLESEYRAGPPPSRS